MSELYLSLLSLLYLPLFLAELAPEVIYCPLELELFVRLHRGELLVSLEEPDRFLREGHLVPAIFGATLLVYPPCCEVEVKTVRMLLEKADLATTDPREVRV